MNNEHIHDWRLHAETGGPVPIPEPGLVCGSWPQADLILPVNEQTSPLLAYLQCQEDRLAVQRADSRGRVAINGSELALHQEHLLQAGDRLTLGNTHYVVACGPAPESQADAAGAIAPDPFADLHVPGLVPVGGPMPAPTDRHPFARPAAPDRPLAPDSLLRTQHWQPELGQAPEWVSTLPDTDRDLLK